jgi:hypothetical protein
MSQLGERLLGMQRALQGEVNRITKLEAGVEALRVEAKAYRESNSQAMTRLWNDVVSDVRSRIAGAMEEVSAAVKGAPGTSGARGTGAGKVDLAAGLSSCLDDVRLRSTAEAGLRGNFVARERLRGMGVLACKPALREAGHDGRREHVELILRAEVTPNVRGWRRGVQEGGLVADAALESGDAVAVHLLLSHGAPVPVPTMARNSRTLAVLLDRGADPNVEANGQCGLHWCAGLCPMDTPKECAALLIDAGADPNRRDRTRRTPLGIAIESGAPAGVIDLLRKAGGDI